jgi:DNA-binding NarL/FixJ family response regulator
MEHKDRTLLIVEDDTGTNEAFKEYCESALEVISRELAIRGTVEQAYNFEDAQQILNGGRTIDVISLDLVLTKDAAEAKGLQLLRELRAKNNQTIAIVVSGELNPKYSIEALQKLGVLAYIFKADLNQDIYQHTVQAALRYLAVEDRVVELEQHSEPDPEALDAAEDQWHNVLADVARADISRRQLPADLEPRIMSLRNKLLDPTTQLPVGKLLRKGLMQRVLNQETLWSLLHVKISNYGTFEATYPWQVKDLLKATGNILKSASQQYSEGEPLVGFMDKLPVIGPSFLIILREENMENQNLALNLRTDIIQEFNSLSESFVQKIEIRADAKQRARKTIREEQGLYLSVSDLAAKKPDLAAKEEDLATQYIVETMSILTPNLVVEMFSSRDDYFGDMNELVDTLANTNSSGG